jgi:hypothetical protein
MAFVVARRDGRFEIRESVMTAAGPRARTLASFRTLTGDVLDKARARARMPVDAVLVRERAAALGAPVRAGGAAATARRLLGELRRGERLPPALVAALRRELSDARADHPDTLDGALEWIGVDDSVRGRVARDLLVLASRLPQRERPPRSAFPRIASGPSR